MFLVELRMWYKHLIFFFFFLVWGSALELSLTLYRSGGMIHILEWVWADTQVINLDTRSFSKKLWFFVKTWLNEIYIFLSVCDIDNKFWSNANDNNANLMTSKIFRRNTTFRSYDMIGLICLNANFSWQKLQAIGHALFF